MITDIKESKRQAKQQNQISITQAQNSLSIYFLKLNEKVKIASDKKNYTE